MFDQKQEILINDIPLRQILAPLLPLVSQSMLSESPFSLWINSFHHRRDIGTVLMGQGLNTQQLFTEVQLNQEALANDSAVQMRWQRARQPFEIGYINPKGAYAEIAGPDSSTLEIAATLNYFSLQEPLVQTLRFITEKVIGKNKTGALFGLARESVLGAGFQFRVRGLMMEVLAEIISGDLNNIYDPNGELNYNSAQQLLKYPVLRHIPNFLSAQARLLRTKQASS